MRRAWATLSAVAPVIVAGALACAGPAAAQSAPPMTVTLSQPSGETGNYFELSVGPGQTKSAGSLRLQNQTERPITVMLDPVRGLTASTLGSAYGLRGSKARGAAGWISLGTRRLDLPPRGRARVPVTVSVPSGAGPGEYLAGISVQAGGSDQVRLEGNVAISQVQRYAVGLVANLPGPRNPGIKLTDVDLVREPAGVTFKVHGRNTGNVILQNVRGEATISDGDDVVAEQKMGPGTFVTDTSIAYPILVPSLSPEQGTAYRVQAFLRYPGGIARIDRVVRFGEIDAKRQQAYGGPAVSDGGGIDGKLLIGGIAALLAAILAALVWRRRRSGDGALRRELPREIAYARESGEPLSVILVPADGGRRPRELASSVSESLRPRDRLFRTRNSGLMVISPDTTPEQGEVLAADIRRQLARGGNGAAVIPVTSAAESSAEELLEAAAAASGEEGARGEGNGGPGNGVGDVRGAEHAARSEVKQGGKEAPVVGGRGGPRRKP